MGEVPGLAAAEHIGYKSAKSDSVVVSFATEPEEFQVFGTLTREYHRWLGEDLCFQSFDQELANLPGCYSRPDGAILLAAALDKFGTRDVAGCVALRPIQTDTHPGRVCEVKRLFVRERFQGLAIGKTLMCKLLDHAKCLSYDVVVLDTLERLTAANSLYVGLGFEKTAPYYNNPLNGVIFWAKRLS